MRVVCIAANLAQERLFLQFIFLIQSSRHIGCQDIFADHAALWRTF
jgi:hypothetical protein